MCDKKYKKIYSARFILLLIWFANGTSPIFITIKLFRNGFFISFDTTSTSRVKIKVEYLHLHGLQVTSIIEKRKLLYTT